MRPRSLSIRRALLLAALTGAAGACESVAGPGDEEPRFTAVSAGDARTCALDTEGNAYCWGLVNGDTVPTLIPTLVPGGHRFKSVDAGGGTGNACGVERSGALICWNGSRAPFRAAAGISVSSVALGGLHSTPCVLDAAGAAFCGYGLFGQAPLARAGDGATPPFASISTSAYRVGNGGSRDPVFIYRHRCALTGAGAAYCWGDNRAGQLGTGTTTAAAAPVPVAGGHTFTSISTSGHSSCALTQAGDTYCWSGMTLSPGAPGTSLVPARVAGDFRFASLDMGGNHACAVAIGGDAYCWGSRFGGVLGTGEMVYSPGPEGVYRFYVPQRVAGGLKFTSVSVSPNDDLGETHSCGVTTDGAVYCWGYNTSGQLGVGTRTPAGTPVRIADPARGGA